MIQKFKYTYTYPAKNTVIKILFGAEIRKCCVLNQSKRNSFNVYLEKIQYLIVNLITLTDYILKLDGHECVRRVGIIEPYNSYIVLEEVNKMTSMKWTTNMNSMS